MTIHRKYENSTPRFTFCSVRLIGKCLFLIYLNQTIQKLLANPIFMQQVCHVR